MTALGPDESPAPAVGVPAALVTDSDYVQVRLALMRHLGGPVEATVFSRIEFRSREENRHSVERDGRRWWTVTLAELAAEMGLSEKQIRRTLDALVRNGVLLREHLREGGPYDRRYAYSPVIAEVPSRAHGGDPQGESQVPHRADVPLSRTEENPPTPQAPASPIHSSPWAGEECDVRRHPRGPHELDGDGLVCVHCLARNPSVTAVERDAISARRKLAALHRDRALPIELDELIQKATRLGDGDLMAGYREVEQRTARPLDGTHDPAAALRSRLRNDGARRVQAA